MKKLVVLCFVLALALSLCLVMGGMAYAEEVDNSVDENQQEVNEEVYPCNIVEDVKGYGDIICDIEGGNIGDIVTIITKPSVFCKLEFIQVNGVDLIANEDGLYQFALVEGDNTVSAKFILDPEQMGALGTYVKQAEEEGIKSLFTWDNVITLICAAVSFFASAGWLWQAIRTSKQNKAFSKLNNDVTTSINNNFASYAANSFAPIIEALNNKIDSVTAITGSLAKCMVIAQENTPQARMAIIDELKSVQNQTIEIGEEIKKLIKAEVDKKIEEKEKQQETIAQLEAQNEAIKVEEPKAEVLVEDEYGQI